MKCRGCEEEIPISRAKQARHCSERCASRSRNKRYLASKTRAELSSMYKDRNTKFRSTPYGKYSDHKNRAIHGGLAFTLTFEEWWSLWKHHWEERGLGGKVMCRFKDQGGYTLGNVRIDTQANNNQESWDCRKGRKNENT